MTLLMSLLKGFFKNKEPDKENLRSVKTLKTLSGLCIIIKLFLFTVSNLFTSKVINCIFQFNFECETGARIL